MFPVPQKGDGQLIAQSRMMIAENDWRDVGDEVDEAWDWKSLPDLLRVGKLKFVPKAEHDRGLPVHLLTFLDIGELREVASARGLDTKGARRELEHRILAHAGFVDAPKSKTKWAGPRSYEESRGPPTPEQLAEEPPAPLGQPASPLAESNAVTEKLATYSDGEARQVGAMYGIDVSAARSRADIIADLHKTITGKMSKAAEPKSAIQHAQTIPVHPGDTYLAPKTLEVDAPVTTGRTPAKK